MLRALHLAALSLVVCLSTVCLGISAHGLNHILHGFRNIPSDSSDHFALATSVVTLLVVIPLILLDAFRVSMLAVPIVVEVGAVVVLWIFWLAVGVDIVSSGLNHFDCSIFTYLGAGQQGLIGPSESFFYDLTSTCRQFKVLEAFAWINWVLLTVAFGIIVCLFIAKSKGDASWRTPVHEFFTRPSRPAGYSMVPSSPASRAPLEE